MGRLLLRSAQRKDLRRGPQRNTPQRRTGVAAYCRTGQRRRHGEEAGRHRWLGLCGRQQRDALHHESQPHGGAEDWLLRLCGQRLPRQQRREHGIRGHPAKDGSRRSEDSQQHHGDRPERHGHYGLQQHQPDQPQHLRHLHARLRHGPHTERGLRQRGGSWRPRHLRTLQHMDRLALPGRQRG